MPNPAVTRGPLRAYSRPMNLRAPIVVALFAVGCAEDNAEALALLDEVEAADYRSSFARAPGYEMPLAPSDGPHGTHVDIYVDATVSEALVAEPAPTAWPDGSIIVKDAWNDEQGEDLRFIALMEKRGDVWYWAEFNGDREVVVAGLDTGRCTGCHDSGMDQVRAFDLPGG